MKHSSLDHIFLRTTILTIELQILPFDIRIQATACYTISPYGGKSRRTRKHLRFSGLMYLGTRNDSATSWRERGRIARVAIDICERTTLQYKHDYKRNESTNRFFSSHLKIHWPSPAAVPAFSELPRPTGPAPPLSNSASLAAALRTSLKGPCQSITDFTGSNPAMRGGPCQ
jgi:hypothetical protein